MIMMESPGLPTRTDLVTRSATGAAVVDADIFPGSPRFGGPGTVLNVGGGAYMTLAAAGAAAVSSSWASAKQKRCGQAAAAGESGMAACSEPAAGLHTRHVPATAKFQQFSDSVTVPSRREP